MPGHSLDIFTRDPLHSREISLRKIKIVRGHPISSEVLRLALHRFARSKSGGGELLDRLRQFLFRHETPFDLVQFCSDREPGRLEHRTVDYTADPEETGITRIVSPGIDRMHQPAPFADFLVKPGAVAIAQKGG